MGGRNISWLPSACFAEVGHIASERTAGANRTRYDKSERRLMRTIPSEIELPASRRWWALAVLCLGVLMIVLDTTIVNVALPSIKTDLGFDDTNLAWIVNIYVLAYGGFLLLGGRLGDIHGHTRLFLAGIVLFTSASVACGLAGSQLALIVARGVQGLGGAVVTAVSMSLIVDLFTDPAERGKAMGAYGFVTAGGGSLGAMAGGILTNSLSWHWVFLINLPVGAAVILLAPRLLPRMRDHSLRRPLDVWGAATITAGLLIAVHAIVNGGTAGWGSMLTVSQLLIALALTLLFVIIEARVPEPIIPLRLFKKRNLAVANIVGVLWIAAMFSWFFLAALYLQLILGYNAMQVGLSFLPANLLMAGMSLFFSARLVARFGLRRPLTGGLSIAAVGLLLFARAPVDGQFLVDVLPAMLLMGLGAGVAFNPLLLAGMNDVDPSDSGVASGVLNTAFMMGGALGLAFLASLAASVTNNLSAGRAPALSALTDGYNAAFFAGACFALIGAGISAAFLRDLPSGEGAMHALQQS